MFNYKNEKLYFWESKRRVYKAEVSLIDMVISEFTSHFIDHINLGYKIYYLNFKSKHNFSLNEDELNYLYTENLRNGEKLFYFFSDNIKKIKLFQRSDLFYLTSLKSLGLLILIPRLDENNRYYFNLVLGVSDDFDITRFNNNDVLKSVKLYSIIELNSFNLSEIFVDKIFDFLNNKFKDVDIISEEVDFWFNEFTGELENSKFSKKGRRYYKKAIFKLICYHVYWLHGENQIKNTLFEIDYGYKEKILIPRSNNEIQIVECYQHSCLEDLLGYNREKLNCMFWKIFEDL